MRCVRTCAALVGVQSRPVQSRVREDKTLDLGKENLLGRGYLSLSTLSLRGISTLDTVS